MKAFPQKNLIENSVTFTYFISTLSNSKRVKKRYVSLVSSHRSPNKKGSKWYFLPVSSPNFLNKKPGKPILCCWVPEAVLLKFNYTLSSLIITIITRFKIIFMLLNQRFPTIFKLSFTKIRLLALNSSLWCISVLACLKWLYKQKSFIIRYTDKFSDYDQAPERRLVGGRSKFAVAHTAQRGTLPPGGREPRVMSPIFIIR